MSIGGGRICVGFLFLCSALTAVLVIGLWLRWKFRSMPAIKARQRYAQSIMMILCYVLGAGWGVCALLFQYQEGGARFNSYTSFVLCLVFGHYAAMDVYFYRVWLFYYKCKLQNEFEKVRRKPPNLGRKTIMKNLLDLTPDSTVKIEITNEGEWKEDLLEWPKPDSVRKSCFVRYRYILGRSMLNKAFWLLLWMCECIVVTWTFQRRSRNKNVRWTTHELADEFFTMIAQLLCLVVLFFFPSDDMFKIKIELRLIFFISTVEIVLYYTFLYQIGTPVAYLSLAICELCIMVAITCSNWKAVQNRCCCSPSPILGQSTSYQLLDSNSESELTIIHILECESLFTAFEKHLKREFSLENLNFIVAVEHYRRLCEERAHSSCNRLGNLSHGKKTVRKTQEISMQPYGVFVVPTAADTSNSSFVSTLTPTVVGPLSSATAMDSEPGTSSHRRTPSDYENTGKHGRKKTPLLSWIKSHDNFCGDMQSTAEFIFDEYCDRGAPQEINLSRRERNEIIEFFSHSIIDIGKLNTIFDNAFDSVLDLLANDSLRRFRRHSSFSKIYKD